MSFFKSTPPSGEPALPAEAEASGVSLPHRPVARWRLLLVALLCAAAALVSGVLLLEHHGVERVSGVVQQVCGEGSDTGCDAVARSRYSQVGGVPLAAIGLVFYLSLALLIVLALPAGPEARALAGALSLAALALALLVDLALLGIQLIAIRAFCKLCILTYALGALAFMLLLRTRRDGRVVGEALARPESRLALLGWSLATALAVGGVLAAEKGLDYRDRLAAASVLGQPLPPATPSGTSASAAPAPPPLLAAVPSPATGDAQRWQEEAKVASEQARRLQEILDDPQKLDKYFAEKAAKEFDAGPVHDLKLDGTPFKGPAQAPIKVVDYSDFLCPFCRNIAAAFSSYLQASAGRVMVYYKHYPLDSTCNPHVNPSIHPGACLLAMGGVCAHEQGRFWSYHDKVFASELKDPDWKAVLGLGAAAGLDVAAFETCLGAQRTKDTVAAQVAEGYGAGVRGTPTLLINGKRLPRINDFAATVDKEAKRLGLPATPAPAH